MKELKPFGDVPDKLSVQIKRSFVATRTYAQALNIAAEMTKALMNVSIEKLDRIVFDIMNPGIVALTLFCERFPGPHKYRLHCSFNKNATVQRL